MEIVTEQQMRALESAAIKAGKVTGRTLMERAGEGVVRAVLEAWPDVGRAVILCGPGNNGGDGYVVARLLAARGMAVAVFATHPPVAGSDAAAAADDWSAAGGEVRPMAALTQDALTGPGAVLVVDALLGIGQSRATDDILAPWWRAMDAADTSGTPALHLVAVDIPTGYGCDTGQRLGANPFPAELVVTFHACKPVHEMLQQAGVAVIVAPIGL